MFKKYQAIRIDKNIHGLNFPSRILTYAFYLESLENIYDVETKKNKISGACDIKYEWNINVHKIREKDC